MATTRYTVAATAATEAKVYSNLKAAKKEADRRALAAGYDVEVVTNTGRLSYTATAPVQAPAPDMASLINEVKTEAENALAEALLPVVKASGRATRREGLGEAAVTGWELLYDKPRQDCQVARRNGEYALICTAHKFVRPVAKLVEERAVRKAGGWCPSCSH
ncbi:hypothetical protein ACFPC0_10620 [Streptomyces andamanensis]|uniref:Uncharacterized protein n=1 Tax=Streptomyces andamanensis TaxID=1565035 RepID=A0ABV8TCM8_9ACTN